MYLCRDAMEGKERRLSIYFNIGKLIVNTQFLSIQSIVTYEAYMDVGHQVPVWNMVRGLNHLGVVWLSLTGN